MGIALGSETFNTASGGSFTTFGVLLPFAVNIGDVLHVIGSVNGAASVFNLPNDSGSVNVYSQVGSYTGNRCQQWKTVVAQAAAANTLTVSVNFSSSQGFPGIWVRQITGSNGVALDGQGANNIAAVGNVLTTPNLNVSAAPALISAWCQDNAIATNATAGTGFTIGLSSSADGTVTEQQVVSSTGTIPATFNTSSGNTFYLMAAAFQQAPVVQTSLEVAYAIQQIIQAGLVPVVQYAPNATVPAGQIVPGSQSPPAGTRVTPGSQQALVSFVVSMGPPQPLGQVSIPNLVGLTPYAAQQALAAAGLSVDNMAFTVSPNPEGTVVTQTLLTSNGYVPAVPGNQVSAGSIIKLTLSTGPAKAAPIVPVPPVS